MKKIIVFSILLLSAIAVTAGTTITIQIQPAYSQAQHCSTDLIGDTSTCVTTGQNPTIQRCEGDDCFDPSGITHQQAGRFIRDCHSTGECTVTPP